MFKSNLRGFTLIELLVVIAIIGILATVVIGAVNSARVKGADAAIKSNLQALRVESELWYDSNNGYIKGTGGTAVTGTCPVAVGTNSFFDTTVSQNSLNAVKKQTAANAAATCYATATGWAVAAPLRNQNQFGTASGVDYICLDSNGNSKISDNNVASAADPSDSTKGCQ